MAGVLALKVHRRGQPKVMDIITLDFETYYDQDYSLFKMTTEEYVRDPRFQIIGLSVKVNNGETAWLSGEFDAIKNYSHYIIA